MLDPTALVSTPVIPVLTIERAADAVQLARALAAGGLTVIEVTLRTPAAIEAVEAITAYVTDCVVGAGTVTRAADIDRAIAAGAKFLVSPGTPADLAAALAVRRCRRSPAARPCRRRWRSRRVDLRS